MPEMFVLTFEMIRCYFFSMHRFFNFLCETFVTNLEFRDQTVGSCVVTLKSSFATALPCLTREHCDVLTILAGRKMGSFVNLLVNDLLLPWLELRAPYLREFIEYLKRSPNDHVCGVAGELLALISSQRVFCPSVPSAPPCSQIPRLALAMSNRDLLLLIDIWGSSILMEMGGHSLKRWAAQNANPPDDMFYIEIPTGIADSEPTVLRPKIEPEYSRLYIRITQESQKSGKQLPALLENPPFCDSFSGDFKRAALVQFVNETRASVSAMEALVKLVQNRLEINRYRESIIRTQNCLLEHLAKAYLKENKEAKKRLARKAFHQFSWDRFTKKRVDPLIEMYTWFAILNLLRLVPDAQLTNLVAMYTNHVTTQVMGRVHVWGSNHMEMMKPLSSLVPRIRQAFRLPYGARLSQLIKVMVELQGYYSGLVKRGNPEWQVMYEFLMVNLDREEMMKSIIVWNWSVLSCQSMNRMSGSVHQTALDEILNGFVTMLVGNQELQIAFGKYVPTFD
jgi:hypothetical protein